MGLKFSYIRSAVHPQDYPTAKKPEIAIAGRSNAGKSSLLNSMAGGEKLAKVSNTPGKTRLLNFFDVGNYYTLVDMPGYGFASRSGGEMRDWQSMIENYLMTRETLIGMVLVMDVRRKWDEEEEMMKNLCEQKDIPLAVVLTKIDKLNRSEMMKAQKHITEMSGSDYLFFVSNLKNQGTKEFEEFLFDSWVKPDLNVQSPSLKEKKQ